jgi:hypothetical protein
VIAVQAMTEAGLTKPFIDVHVIFTRMTCLSTRLLTASLPSQPSALQALYGTRKKLSASQWHVYAVEHMLPGAFILGHAGMGAVLQTYYRKKKDSDNGHIALLNAAEAGDAWKVGQVCMQREHLCHSSRHAASLCQETSGPTMLSNALGNMCARTSTAGSGAHAGDVAEPRRPLALPHWSH